MTKAEFRKKSSMIISSVEAALKMEGSRSIDFEADADYESGRIGNFYSARERMTLCVQVFLRHDDPTYIMVTIIVPYPDDFIQIYPELNAANDELRGAKAVYNKDENAIAIVCEIDTRNWTKGDYGLPIVNGVKTVLENMILVLEQNLLEGVVEAVRSL